MSNFKVNFIAIGPQRTGSTWLYKQLSHSPDICFPKDVKETFFFDNYYSKGIDWYASHFKHQQENQINGEVGPTYFNSPQAMIRIAENNPNCKILINVRHPIDRVISLYWHYLSIGKAQGSFGEAITAEPHILDAGKYSKYIPRWSNTFGKKNIKLLVLDDIKSSPDSLLLSIANHLNIPEIKVTTSANKKVNTASLPRFPLAAKLLTNTSLFLRKNRLHKIVELGKNMGLRSVYSGAKEEFPLPETEEIKMLYSIFTEDIEFVETSLQRKLESWYVYE